MRDRPRAFFSSLSLSKTKLRLTFTCTDSVLFTSHSLKLFSTPSSVFRASSKEVATFV